jgi:hypothetical protein
MFWRRRKRLDEEIESHLTHELADNIARGLDPEAARRAALRSFGNIGVVRETMREYDPLYWLDTLWQDVRFAFRLIARNRWTSMAIVATLTAGIALNVSVFGLLNGLMLRPWVRSQPGKLRQPHSAVLGRVSPSLLQRRNVATELRVVPRFGKVTGITRGVPCSEGHARRRGSRSHSRRPCLL